MANSKIGFGTASCWLWCILFGQKLISAYIILVDFFMIYLVKIHDPESRSEYETYALHILGHFNIIIAFAALFRINQNQSSEKRTFLTQVLCVGMVVVAAILFVIFLVVGVKYGKDSLRNAYLVLLVSTKFRLVLGVVLLLVEILEMANPPTSEPAPCTKKWFRFFVIQGLISHTVGSIIYVAGIVWTWWDPEVKGTNFLLAAALVTPLLLHPEMPLEELMRQLYANGYTQNDGRFVWYGMQLGALWHSVGVCCYLLPLMVESKVFCIGNDRKRRRALWRTWSCSAWARWFVRIFVIVTCKAFDLWSNGSMERKYGAKYGVPLLLIDLAIVLAGVSYALFFDGIILLVTKYRFEEVRNRGGES